MLMSRLASTPSLGWKALHVLRTLALREDLAQLRSIREQLGKDPEFRAFHHGDSERLPAFYRHRYARVLGRYSELISEAEMRPVLDPPPKLVGAAPSPPTLPQPPPRSKISIESRL